MAPTTFPSTIAWGSSLPLLDSISSITSYTETVQPYHAQLSLLPYRLLDAALSLDGNGLLEAYTTTNPLITAFAISLALAPIFFVVSEANRNYSQVDRVWSLLPTVYNAHFWFWAAVNDIRSSRLDAVLCISSLWSIRLTYNYWRKGGYSIGSEDYRWEIVKARVGNMPVWVIFNAVFISLIQSVLLFTVTMPTYILLLASQFEGPSLTAADTFFIGLLLCLIVIEFTADEQQWRYHVAKKTYRETARLPKSTAYSQDDLDRGFNTSGLWRYSRHPNFAAEQAVWVALYQWCCVESGSTYNWTGIGALAYLALFQGSTALTEGISAGKYPEYAEYQDRVGRFLPRLVGQTWGEYLEQQAGDDASSSSGEEVGSASVKRKTK